MAPKDKQKAIQMLNAGQSYSQIYRETGFSEKTQKRYLALYAIGGEEAVLRQGHRYYQTAEKAGAAIEVLNGGSIPDIAAKLGATQSSVRAWAQLYEAGGVEALKDRRRLRRGCKTVSQQDYEMLTTMKKQAEMAE